MASSLSDVVSDGESSDCDTHPPLRDRLGALGRLPSQDDVCVRRSSGEWLFDDIDHHSIQLLTFTAGQEAVGARRRVDWDQAAKDVYPQQWREMTARAAGFLASHTVDALPFDRTVRAKLGSQLPGGGTRSSDERVRGACWALSAGVALALLDSGATLDMCGPDLRRCSAAAPV
jgi:hypothetical protein